MSKILNSIETYLKAGGFTPKALTVENMIVLHDEGYYWTITDSGEISRYDDKMNVRRETFKNFSEFMDIFEAMMTERESTKLYISVFNLYIPDINERAGGKVFFTDNPTRPYKWCKGFASYSKAVEWARKQNFALIVLDNGNHITPTKA